MCSRFESGMKMYFTFLVLFAMMVIFAVLNNESLRNRHKPVLIIVNNESPRNRHKPWNPALTCDQPPGGFKAWKNGLLTVLKPEIPRKCQKLFDNDQEEIERAKNDNKVWKNELSDDEFLQKTRNCSWVREELSDNLYNTQFEKHFPLAFTFVIHAYPQQVFRLIKVLYRQQNIFCIHYDAKSPGAFKTVFDIMARCLDNIIIASKIIKVEWGSYTTMEAQMNCFSDLVKRRQRLPAHQQWKYTLNLCGTELPLVTNHDIVVHLNSLEGSSCLLPGLVTKNSNSWKRIHPPIPYNMTYYKSSSYNALSYKFVEYLVENPVGIKMYAYFRIASSPEEHLYSTVYMHPGVPGGFREEFRDKYIDIAKATWCFSKESIAACHGKVVHSVCVCVAGDLPKIMATAKKSANFFHNKYVISKDHTAMDCMEERIVKRNQEEYKEDCKHLLSTNQPQ